LKQKREGRLPNHGSVASRSPKSVEWRSSSGVDGGQGAAYLGPPAYVFGTVQFPSQDHPPRDAEGKEALLNFPLSSPQSRRQCEMTASESTKASARM